MEKLWRSIENLMLFFARKSHWFKMKFLERIFEISKEDLHNMQCGNKQERQGDPMAVF